MKVVNQISAFIYSILSFPWHHRTCLESHPPTTTTTTHTPQLTPEIVPYRIEIAGECAACEGAACEGCESGICDLDHSSTYPHTFSGDPTAALQIQIRIRGHSHLYDHRSCRQYRIYMTGVMPEGEAENVIACAPCKGCGIPTSALLTRLRFIGCIVRLYLSRRTSDT